ncbi:MAG: helix-turn-helix domain-containing protein [Ktedonobacteraceae bacterium]
MRILRAVDEGKPRPQIIDLFHVSRATIKRYLKRRRETGNVEPQPIRREVIGQCCIFFHRSCPFQALLATARFASKVDDDPRAAGPFVTRLAKTESVHASLSFSLHVGRESAHKKP